MKEFRYAHRGLHDISQGIPENSLPAFRRAIGHGYGAELDVHLLSDGTLAVFHDTLLKRMTGREGIIESLTAADLADCRLGGTEETIPQFHEVLALFDRAKLPLVVELKPLRTNYAELTERTVNELDKYAVPYVIESFDPRCLLWLKRNRPEIIRGQLAQNFLHGEPSGLGVRVDRFLTYMAFNRVTKPNFVAYRFEDRDMPVLRWIKKHGSAVIFYWTIRSREDMERAEAEGAQVIFEGFLP
ncbi:MAG: glycerophosphodiester phosphodiesterase [Ruminococcaceae bacterium]|jgi:glycerophosphoryl diester phosphodiesterase|nr:glycerophosphodiester phosphodiesterase [Oscillospiraceae bacterium]